LGCWVLVPAQLNLAIRLKFSHRLLGSTAKGLTLDETKNTLMGEQFSHSLAREKDAL
jgi:hypothetical protein